MLIMYNLKLQINTVGGVQILVRWQTDFGPFLDELMKKTFPLLLLLELLSYLEVVDSQHHLNLNYLINLSI